MGAVRPDARQAVRLQFNADLKRVRVGLFNSLFCLLYLGQDSKQVLHVVPDLVGDNVGLRELAGLASDVTTTEAALKILEEA